MIEWGKMWVSSDYDYRDDSHLHVIRVQNENVNGQVVSVANAYNGTVWIRRPLSTAIEPGVYGIELDGGLGRINDYRGDYPDLELKMPNFQAVTMIKAFSLQELQEIAFFLQKAKEAQCSTMYLNNEGIYTSIWDRDDEDDDPPLLSFEKDWFSKLPIKKEIGISVTELGLAINEMVYYQGQEVVLMHPQDNGLPLIFGVSPEACAIITEYRSKI